VIPLLGRPTVEVDLYIKIKEFLHIKNKVYGGEVFLFTKEIVNVQNIIEYHPILYVPQNFLATGFHGVHGVRDTGEKFIGDVVDTGEQFFGGVVATGDITICIRLQSA
jgi:hypothetical protein